MGRETATLLSVHFTAGSIREIPEESYMEEEFPPKEKKFKKSDLLNAITNTVFTRFISIYLNNK